jgi:hypothetical protein
MGGPLDRTWYNALVDDAGTGTTGTVWNKAQINNLLNSVDNSLAPLPAGPATSTAGDVATFTDTTGKVVGDSGVAVATVARGAASATAGHLATFADSSGKVLSDSGVVAATVVTGPATAGNGNVALFGDTTGKLLSDLGAGAPVIIPFNAANFVGVGSTWTVAAAQVPINQYVKIAHLCAWTILIYNTTSLSAPTNQLQVLGLPAAYQTVNSIGWGYFGGAWHPIATVLGGGSGLLQIFVDPNSATSFPAGALGFNLTLAYPTSS